MSAPTVTVYGPPKVDARAKCMKCEQTKRHMSKKGIAFTEAVLDGGDVIAAQYLGLGTAPVVVVSWPDGRDDEVWDDYRPDRIDALAAAS